MKRILIVILIVLITNINLFSRERDEKLSYQPERELQFNEGWRFYKGLADGAKNTIYDDSGWRFVDLPHDWSIEDLPTQIKDSIIGPFDKGVPGGQNLGYVRGGTGWYRKTFKLSAAEKDKSVRIHFDGVFMTSTVWLNGHLLGTNHHGYMPFWYDLTPYLKPAGQNNIIAVKVENEGVTGRWYSGSGIYRNVCLNITDRLHVSTWGVKVTTPEVSEKNACVQIETKIDNGNASAKNLTLVTYILTPDNHTVATTKSEVTMAANENGKTIGQQVNVSNPRLWSVETPSLYQVVSEIRDHGKLKDKVITQFGIRSIEFSAEKGFLLNGKRIILKGGCIHHDNGLIGSVSYRQAEERKIALLKRNGYNAIRTSHNPASQWLLDACDRQGMLVITEAYDVWTVEKSGNPQDYHLYFNDNWERDIENFVMRDQNHPSIIMWSIGNEIPERVTPEGVEITKKLTAKFRQLDNTRPLTEAFCRYLESMNAGRSWSETVEPMSYLDVIGYNYLGERYFKKDHQKFPKRIMFSSEIYPDKSLFNYTTAQENPYVLGDFIWTAIDYMGEVAIGRRYISPQKELVPAMGWPWYNANCGDIDLIGNDKPQSYYRRVVWDKLPIAIAVHAPIGEGMVENISQWGWPDERQSWTWNDCIGKQLNVRIYSRAPMVRLYLNGQMVGEQQIASNSVQADFQITYQPGEMKAVNVVDGKETDQFVLKSVGQVANIKLAPEQKIVKAERSQIVYVMVELTDSKGSYDANIGERQLSFGITGEAEILAVGNANPTEPMSFQGKTCQTYNGKCLVVLRSKGTKGMATLTASSEGIPTVTTKVDFQ